MTELMAVIGISFLLFRLWLVEVKLPDELQFRRRYLSRVINYYTALALAFSLSSVVLNLIVMISFPILLVTTSWDIKFYRRFRSRDYWKKNRRWVLLESLTLHPPVFGVGLAMILVGAEPLIRAPNLLFILAAAVLMYVPFFLFDARWTDRYN